ncbi:snare protein syntaxin 18 ufe1 [Moniliophthora roreri MCA 2997]|uniref:Snare protein syntaxin 18 ufe1 n=2 Tax=Moniliophthora roreri TaxID=221103 RepID=V2XV81_MONRO|nr:snare protein syntaxin 18 ufe1 [Moniliophthora roreri MCA 2997]KAI3612507.1 snare protein syntaxin 18 ufe1 [Moniliophthora roreri]
MAYSDRTNDFKDCVQQRKGKEREKRPRTPPTRQRDDEVQFGKEYVSEAYKILTHISRLTRMLAFIRKPYLNVDSRATTFTTPRILDFSSAESWSNIKQLSNEERDEIDLQARVILSRCAERVKEMEALEKRRVELLASKVNPITRLLPARLRQDESSVLNNFIAAHHTSITWYLNRRLAEASQNQKEMQEERVKRQLERTRTLGSGAAFEAQGMLDGQRNPGHLLEAGPSSSWLGGASSSIIAATIGAPPPDKYSTQSSIPVSDIPSDDDDADDLELSASQILQFETENANILREVQDKLESVQQAEARLLEISALQMELVTHLTAQTELSDQLYEDAIATTSTVEKGNEQLREARRRMKDSRLFILVFLIGASMSLLFLHYY